MPDKKTKIQPVDIADDKVGQPSAEDATGELPDYTVEQIAGMKPEEVAKIVGNAKEFIKSATQKSQEAAEIRKQSEQLRAESKYYKTQAEEATKNLQKFYEQMSQLPQQQTPSAPSQPPEYDPYNPDQWARNYQKWHEEQLKTTRNEFDKKFEELKSEAQQAGTDVRTLRMEKYLDKAIPEFGKDVTIPEIDAWVRQHPNADLSAEGWMETLNQAIRECQGEINTRNEARWKEYVAEKEKQVEGAQEVPGSAFAGEVPNIDEFVSKTPADKDTEVMKFFERQARKVQGGGG